MRATAWQRIRAILRQRNTLRARFALGTGLLLLGALVSFSGFVYVRLGTSLLAELDDSLRLSAAQAAAAVEYDGGRLTPTDKLPATAVIARIHERDVIVRILNPDGTLVQAVGAARSVPLSAEARARAAQGKEYMTTASVAEIDEPLRIYTAPIWNGEQVIGIVQVGQSVDSIEDTLRRLVQTLLIGIPLMIGLAMVGGYLLVAQALRPIDQMTRTAQRMSATALDERINLPAADDEVGRLAQTFDQMLARLAAAFARERRFTADASHELRTPLAAMQAILEVTRAQVRTPAVYEQALDDLLDETQRLRALVADLLRLARSDAGTTGAHAPVDLSTMLADVAETLTPLTEAKGIQIETAIAPHLQTVGDSDELIRLWLNLVDNAIAYTDTGTITIRATASAPTVCVQVCDTGIGIAADHLPQLGERFYRVDAARHTGGTGLGLAIAQAIVHAHAGHMLLTSEPGRGTVVTVELPRLSRT